MVSNSPYMSLPCKLSDINLLQDFRYVQLHSICLAARYVAGATRFISYRVLSKAKNISIFEEKYRANFCLHIDYYFFLPVISSVRVIFTVLSTLPLRIVTLTLCPALCLSRILFICVAVVTFCPSNFVIMSPL